ncbi:hypothetical protein AUC71_16075 [Methyloceanibacter marginalis]|uniref:YARHG domain-containing protein n=2 Tax=Methyloceanibacter marginalis TaxID=1774971 RepID=A0A1E3W938_9HYPH|nr:hypothetical protein AUC71_16075 [Methyloceanibacter marginalis]
METPMTKLNRMILISVAALMSAAVTTSAMAASKQDCRTYAENAVFQSNTMQAQNRGCTGWRWHNWYDGHYSWCRKVSKDTARAEYWVRQQTIANNGPC